MADLPDRLRLGNCTFEFDWDVVTGSAGPLSAEVGTGIRGAGTLVDESFAGAAFAEAGVAAATFAGTVDCSNGRAGTDDPKTNGCIGSAKSAISKTPQRWRDDNSFDDTPCMILVSLRRKKAAVPNPLASGGGQAGASQRKSIVSSKASAY